MQAGGWEPVTSPQQFFSFTEAHRGCVVYCAAPWCFRCKQVAEKVATFPYDYPQLQFYVVDLEDCEELGELLAVATLPTFLLLSRGTEVGRLEGVPQQRPARALAQAIKKHLLGDSGS